jgi:tetratricopeptide (TPR) repeat protein
MHYADGELAHLYMAAGKFDEALEHAKAEYNRRPDNIEANETLAWAWYNKGDYKKAQQHIEVALRTNCGMPDLLAKAGLIYKKANDQQKARLLLTRANNAKACLPALIQEAVTKAVESL